MGVQWLAPPEMMNASLRQWINSVQNPNELLQDLLEVALYPENLAEQVYSRELNPYFPNRVGFPARELALAMTNVVACHMAHDHFSMNQHLLVLVDAIIAVTVR